MPSEQLLKLFELLKRNETTHKKEAAYKSPFTVNSVQCLWVVILYISIHDHKVKKKNVKNINLLRNTDNF